MKQSTPSCFDHLSEFDPDIVFDKNTYVAFFIKLKKIVYCGNLWKS